MIDLPPKVNVGDPIRASTLNMLIDAIRRSRILPSSTLKVSSSQNGTTVELVGSKIQNSTVGKSDVEFNIFPYKLHVFREEYTDSTTGEKTYRYYCGCYIPNGSCVVNGNVLDLRNTENVSSIVDVDRLSDSDKGLLKDYGNDWYSISPTSDGGIYVHVLEEKGVYDDTGEVYGDSGEYVVTNSPRTPYTAGDTSIDGVTLKRIKWTFRVGSFRISQDGSVSVSSQVLNTTLMLYSGNNGKNGGYYIPHVDASGNLTFTPSDTGSMSDITGNWNIKGDTGATGATGPIGPTGASGEGMTGGDWSRLEDAINAATGAAGQANGAASSANGAAASANSAAQSASNAATTATTAATAASNAAQNAINAAENASAAAGRADQSSQLSESQAQQVQEAIALAQDAAEAATKAAEEALDAAEEASNAVGPTGPTGDSGGVLFAESVETFAIDKNGDWSTYQPEGN